jgi:hypothetical protein
MKRLLGSAVLVLCVYSAQAWADDIYDIPWQRFQGRTTYQHWSFGTFNYDTNNDNWPPDAWYGPHEPGLGDNGLGWQEEWYEGRNGVYIVDLKFEVDIDNYPSDINSQKVAYIQVVWHINGPIGLPSLSAEGTDGAPDMSVSIVQEEILDGPGSGWVYTCFEMTIEPNPQYETIEIAPQEFGGRLYIDQLVIDTICIPEPAGMFLLGLGSILAMSRRPGG